MSVVVLEEEEARGLVLLLLEGADAATEGVQPRDTYAGEMILWAEMILDRMGFRRRPEEER